MQSLSQELRFPEVVGEALGFLLEADIGPAVLPLLPVVPLGLPSISNVQQPISTIGCGLVISVPTARKVQNVEMQEEEKVSYWVFCFVFVSGLIFLLF